MTGQATTAGQARYGVIVLLVVALFNYMDRALISVLQVPIKAELGLTDTQLGALTGLAFAALYVLAAVPLAQLADRYPRFWVLAGALALWSSMTALSSLATGFIMLLILRMGVAVGEAGGAPPTLSLISDYFPLRRRGTMVALWAATPALGMMLGVSLGGVLANGLGWRTSFAVFGLAGLLLVPLLLRAVEPIRGQFDPVGRRQDSAPPLRVGLQLLWQSRAFRFLLAGAGFQAFSTAAVQSWLVPFYSRVHDVPLTQVAIWVALMIGLAGGAGSFAGGFFADRLSRRDVRWYGWLMGSAVLAAFVLHLALLLAPAVGISVVIGFPAMFFASIYLAPLNVTAHALVPPNIRALTSAVTLLVPTIVGFGLGPLVTGALSDLFTQTYGMGDEGLRWAILACTLSWVPAATFWLLMTRHLRREVLV